MRFLDFGYSATVMLGSFAILLLLCGMAALAWRWSLRWQGGLR
jgi:multiple sugar transport system permease protein